MGLKQVAEIEAEMLKLARQQGYNDLPSFNEHIRKDPQLYASSGEQLLGLYKHYTDQMYAKLPQLFGRLPKTKLIVVPMEAFRSANAVPADYSIGAGDGSRPGRINVNEYDPRHRLLFNVEAIAYHEGIPGHHQQFSIAQEQMELPAFRRFASYNAYSEGWAFYAERLGREVGFYQDPYSEYGRLENEMWRSVRLVVDTGVHAKHWSRQQMVDFFRQHTAMDEPNIETEVDRYIAWPGQALAYKLGQMKIIELRERARQTGRPLRPARLPRCAARRWTVAPGCAGGEYEPVDRFAKRRWSAVEGSADLMFKSAIFPCLRGKSRGPKKHVRATTLRTINRALQYRVRSSCQIDDEESAVGVPCSAGGRHSTAERVGRGDESRRTGRRRW